MQKAAFCCGKNKINNDKEVNNIFLCEYCTRIPTARTQWFNETPFRVRCEAEGYGEERGWVLPYFY